MRTLGILILLGLSAAAGYYIGNDHGYEKAVFEQGMENETPDITATEYSLSAAEEALLGLWRSNDDARFTREFKNDGAAVDLYDNGDSVDRTQLSWNVFNEETPDPDFKGEYEPLTTYLRMSNGTDDLFFKLIKITPESLEMVYLDRGGVLTFQKVAH